LKSLFLVLINSFIVKLYVELYVGRALKCTLFDNSHISIPDPLVSSFSEHDFKARCCDSVCNKFALKTKPKPFLTRLGDGKIVKKLFKKLQEKSCQKCKKKNCRQASKVGKEYVLKHWRQLLPSPAFPYDA
jgi:hypothetical protein